VKIYAATTGHPRASAIILGLEPSEGSEPLDAFPMGLLHDCS
jgi:hypothetical protein